MMYYKKKKFGYKPRSGYKRRKKVIRKRNATIIVIPRKRRW